MKRRIAVHGNPTHPIVDWTPQALTELMSGGYDTVQLNVAWSYRPGDEVLNLEDLTTVPGSIHSRAKSSDAGSAARAEIIRTRASTAQAVGLRTLLHVGAPYQGRAGFDGLPLPQCISKPEVVARYADALVRLGQEQPDIDELLIYTYDQDAWLCSEFDGCDACYGIPLHERLPNFLRALSAAWTATRSGRMFWWEPWELSSGQTLACVRELAGSAVGLIVHNNIAEVISTMPGDVFVRNLGELALEVGIPVVAEVFTSSENEEVEPWSRLPSPLVTVSQLRLLDSVPGIVGTKEYFGIAPSQFDVNQAAAVAYQRNPLLTDDEILSLEAERWGRPWLVDFWTLTSRAYRLYPWDASWFARQLGRSEPVHSLSAATIRGSQSAATQWNTPAWRSSRAAIFLRTENGPVHPWMIEDLQLRFGAALREMEGALQIFEAGFIDDGGPADQELLLQAEEASGFLRRCKAYFYHLRETNLAMLMRQRPAIQPRLIAELRLLLVEDLENQLAEIAHHPKVTAAPTPIQISEKWVVEKRLDTTLIREAIDLLDNEPAEFLSRFFVLEPDHASAGQFSLTSR